jgi:hypothetical protein
MTSAQRRQNRENGATEGRDAVDGSDGGSRAASKATRGTKPVADPVAGPKDISSDSEDVAAEEREVDTSNTAGQRPPARQPGAALHTTKKRQGRSSSFELADIQIRSTPMRMVPRRIPKMPLQSRETQPQGRHRHSAQRKARRNLLRQSLRR